MGATLSVAEGSSLSCDADSAAGGPLGIVAPVESFRGGFQEVQADQARGVSPLHAKGELLVGGVKNGRAGWGEMRAVAGKWLDWERRRLAPSRSGMMGDDSLCAIAVDSSWQSEIAVVTIEHAGAQQYGIRASLRENFCFFCPLFLISTAGE